MSGSVPGCRDTRPPDAEGRKPRMLVLHLPRAPGLPLGQGLQNQTQERRCSVPGRQCRCEGRARRCWDGRASAAQRQICLPGHGDCVGQHGMGCSRIVMGNGCSSAWTEEIMVVDTGLERSRLRVRESYSQSSHSAPIASSRRQEPGLPSGRDNCACPSLRITAPILAFLPLISFSRGTVRLDAAPGLGTFLFYRCAFLSSSC